VTAVATEQPSPLVSLLVAVGETEPQTLHALLASVLAQAEWDAWEVVLVDDATRLPALASLMADLARDHPRFRLVRRGEPGGRCAALNDALDAAAGAWVAVVDPSDLLAPRAVRTVVDFVHTWPEVDVLYSDENVLREDQFVEDYHKPGFSPEALLGQDLFGRLTAYRKSVVVAACGLRCELEGAEEWDLALRVTERTDAVRHMPFVLCHRHAAAGGHSPTAVARDALAARRALTEALTRRREPGEVTAVPGTRWWRVARPVVGDPLVTVVIPTVGTVRELEQGPVRLVDRCVRGLLERTDYPHWEAVVVLSPATEESVRRDLTALAGDRLRFLDSRGPFSFSAAINRGAAHARGSHLLMLNDDIEPIDAGWLRTMLGAAAVPGVGAVGARLLYEDGRVQHAGVVHNREALPFHLQAGEPDGIGYFGELVLDRAYLAVTAACLLTPLPLFREVGGLSTRFPVNYNDVDYCLKLWRRGLRSVYAAAAVLHHYESSSRAAPVTIREIDDYLEAWHYIAHQDPFGPDARLPAGAAERAALDTDLR